MTHDESRFDTDADSTAVEVEADPAALPCPGRRAMLGCALALSVTQLLGISEAEAATGQCTSAGAPSGFAIGKPKLLKLASGRAPVFITKLAATSFQALYAVCTHEVHTVGVAPGHTNYAFRCPKHGAKFDKTGKVLANQKAKRALVKLPVKIVKNKVMVNVAGFV
ncbi:MAG: Rieske (2Fe-2S) protein [Proteobacteria bacterium]|nr:Rieske (2Fe-2S) protein [Pseudomonadota bacterium]